MLMTDGIPVCDSCNVMEGGEAFLQLWPAQTFGPYGPAESRRITYACRASSAASPPTGGGRSSATGAARTAGACLTGGSMHRRWSRLPSGTASWAAQHER